jgi:hypothetical protein
MGKRRRRRRSWRWVVGGGVLGLALGLFVVMAIRAAQEEPRLVVLPETNDLGEIGRLRGTVRADFQVENRGTGSLRIRRIVPS